MKVHRAVSEDINYCLIDLGARKFLSEKRKKYLLELFEECDSEHLKQINKDFDDYPYNNSQINKDFDDYPYNNSLPDIIREEEGM